MNRISKRKVAATRAERYRDYPVDPCYGSTLLWEELRGWYPRPAFERSGPTQFGYEPNNPTAPQANAALPTSV